MKLLNWGLERKAESIERQSWKQLDVIEIKNIQLLTSSMSRFTAIHCMVLYSAAVKVLLTLKPQCVE